MIPFAQKPMGEKVTHIAQLRATGFAAAAWGCEHYLRNGVWPYTKAIMERQSQQAEATHNSPTR